MAKSIKRVIACLLAVLMVAFSMPFTALAAAGDYEPDIELYFYPIYGDGLGSYDPVTGTKKGVDPSVGAGSLGDVAFDFKNGTLSVTPEKYADYISYNELESAADLGVFGEDGTETWTLGEGDFFGVVVVCKNVETLFALSGALKFSDNITPAGFDRSLTGSGAKQRNVLTLRALDDAEAEGDWAYEGYSDDVSGALYGCATNMNEIDANGNIFFAISGDQPCSDVSSVEGEEYFNPKTGELGYNFENECIVGTYLFQITDATTPITFEAADPNNEIYGGNAGGLYIATTDDGAAIADMTTYAVNEEDPAAPGSQKMTYFAEKEEEPEDTYYTVTYKDAAGEVIRTEEVKENESPANIPALPEASGHDSYAWDVDPNGAVITAATTFTQVKSTSQHEYEETARVASTCSTQGSVTYTCSICGDTYDDPLALDPNNHENIVTDAAVPATCTTPGKTEGSHCEACGTTIVAQEDTELAAHTPGEAVRENEVPASCSAEGSYDEVVYCTVCGAELSRETKSIDKIAHTPGAAVRENEVAASCSAEGSYDEVVYCSVCHEELSRETKTIDKLAHTPGEAVRENEVPASCTAEGSYDEVVYCSVCNEELSRETKTIDKIAHNYVADITAPTCTEQGYTTYTCSECGDSYVADYTDALGHAWGEATFAWTGYTAATATRVCANDASHVEAVDAVITSVTTPATATEDGKTVYTATATFEDGTVATNEKEDIIPATGYTYSFDHFDWAADYSSATAVLVANEDATVTTTAAASVTSAYTAHTQEAKGYTTYTATYVYDGETYTEDQVAEDAEFAHEYAVSATTPATCTEDGTVTYTCSICGDSYTDPGDPATGHAWGEATFAWTGYTAATATRVCANDETHVETVDAVITSETTPATPLEDGATVYTATATFEDGTVATDEQTEVIPATGYTYTFDHFDWAADYTSAKAIYVADQDATVTKEYDAEVTSAYTAHTQDAKGYTTYTATYESETEDKTVEDEDFAHEWSEWTESEAAVAPTRTTPGKTAVETRTCSICGAVETKGGEEIAPIEGVKITANITDEGEVEFSDNNIGMEDDGFLYTYGDNYKLTAIPMDGYKFEGWYYNTRLLSTELVYNNVAYTDLDITAKFVKVAQDEFTVTFLGKYGNVADEQTVTSGDQITIPEAPALPGYEFVAWTIDGAAVDEAAIAAIDDSTVVQASYKKLTTGSYTINAPEDAEITLPAGIENGSIPYDTKATVYIEGAEAIVDENGNVLANGDTYTFYVGSDITLEASKTAAADAVVAIISANKDAVSGKYSIIANRAVPDGWEVKDRGFVVGLAQNVSADKGEIIANLDTPATGVKVTHGTPTASNQFSYLCKIGAGKTLRAYAYIVIQKGSETKVVMSEYYDVVAE